MITKIVIWLIALLGCAHMMQPGQSVSAAEHNSTIVLHKRIYRDVRAPDTAQYQNDGLLAGTTGSAIGSRLLDKSSPLNNVNFEVFDLTDAYTTAKAQGQHAKAFNDAFMAQHQNSRRAALKYARANLPLVGRVKTGTSAQFQEDGIGTITVPDRVNDHDAAYLIIETSLDMNAELNVDLEKQSQPMIVCLPAFHPVSGDQQLDTIHLYPKNVGYVRDPFFFKFGQTHEGKHVRIEGATFALYRYEAGKKLYLSMDPVTDLKNVWVESGDPLHDKRVNLFISDRDGLVNTGERFLPSGTYYFEELQAATGWINNLKDEAVRVEIPDAWEDEDGNFQPVRVNGEVMDETISGIVQTDTITKGRPRVYNQPVKSKSDPQTDVPSRTPQITTTSTTGSGFMPALGDTLSFGLIILGLVLMVGIWLYERHHHFDVTDDN